jgi:hypothetical protein
MEIAEELNEPTELEWTGAVTYSDKNDDEVCTKCKVERYHDPNPESQLMRTQFEISNCVLSSTL